MTPDKMFYNQDYWNNYFLKDIVHTTNEGAELFADNIDKNFKLNFFEIILAPVDFPVAPAPSQATCIILFLYFKSNIKTFHNF